MLSTEENSGKKCQRSDLQVYLVHFNEHTEECKAIIFLLCSACKAELKPSPLSSDTGQL